MHNRSMTIHKEMLELLPMESPFKTVGAMFKSCAVVGNGGILRNSSCGKKIDQSDFVFRSNLQPIQEYVRDAGSKVNFSTISQSLLSNFRYPDTYKYILNFTNFNTSKFISAFDEYKDFILWIPNSRYSSNMTFNITQLVRKTTNLQMLLYNVEHSEKIQTFWNLTRKGLSTGLILTSIGLSLCDEVNLYGFWPFPFDHKGRDLPMHYTEDLLWDTYRNFHDYPSEFILLTKLHRQGVLKLHLDKCFVDSLS
ncbi:alpha-N-acetylneuraminide alpha-2,8-sialyltransferase-like [Saccoglossus kowalevskii]